MPQLSFVKVTPHVYRLDLPFFGGRASVGVWLVQDDQGWLVIDAGAPDVQKTVLEQVLAATGGQTPRLLILTHGHLDHAGAAEAMRDQWKVPVAAGRDEIPYLLGPIRYRQIPTHFLPYKLLQLSPPPLVGRNVQLPLDDGSQVGPLTAYHAPGHAPGMLALLHREDRALICGDAFGNRVKLGDPAAPFTYDMRLAHKSQARLMELDFDHLLPSHGAPLMNTGREQGRALLASRDKKTPRARLAAA